jgi:hypothetical protein
MPLVDLYAPCLCGSGRKYKFCCAKAESSIKKVQLARENGQSTAEAQAIEEGLARHPDAPFFVINKAILESEAEQVEPARARLTSLLQKMPDHAFANALLARMVGSEGVDRLTTLVQDRLDSAPASQRAGMAGFIAEAAEALTSEGRYVAALAHARLADRIDHAEGEHHHHEDEEQPLASRLESLERLAPWLKEPYEFGRGPADTSPEFDEALRVARDGRWRDAATQFRAIAERDGSPAAIRNHGLCRLFLGEEGPAAAALGRYRQGLGPDAAEESLDLTALLQLIQPPNPDELVDRLQLSWKVRSRKKLIEAFDADPTILAQGRPNAQQEGESDAVLYAIVDRPLPEVADPEQLQADQIPPIRAHLIVEGETLTLEGYDDGRLDGLTQKVIQAAGEALPPAHPKTKKVGADPIHEVALRWEWIVPPGVTPFQLKRLQRARRLRMLKEIWPQTKMPWLKGKTPAEAAKVAGPDERRSLAAAMAILEYSASTQGETDLAEIRQSFGLEPEAELDPVPADFAGIPLCRLHLVPAAKLDDERLLAFFELTRRYGLKRASHRAALALAARPTLFNAKVDTREVYGELIDHAYHRGDAAELLRTIERGRQADPEQDRADRAVTWDLMAVRMRSQIEKPEQWVPDLARVMEQYRENQQAAPVITATLVDMGLLRLVADPMNPEQVFIDTRMLRQVLSRFGPRIVSASGAPTAGGGGSKIWTPGQPSGPGGESKSLIIPGR